MRIVMWTMSMNHNQAQTFVQIKSLKLHNQQMITAEKKTTEINACVHFVNAKMENWRTSARTEKKTKRMAMDPMEIMHASLTIALWIFYNLVNINAPDKQMKCIQQFYVFFLSLSVCFCAQTN